MSYFNKDEVVRLDQIQNKKIVKVLYHYWINVAKVDEEVKVLDTLEIHFGDGESLAFTGRTDECLKIVTPNIEADAQDLMKQFNGKIVLSSMDMTESSLWSELGTLNHISLRKGDGGQYLNDAVLLSCDQKEVVIFFDGDSIEAEQVFEEME